MMAFATLPLELKQNPLVCVLAQVVIAPVLQMGQYIPAIQERLRKSGFPLFRAEEIRELEFGPQAALKMGFRWLFYNKEQTIAAIVAPNFVSLQASQYTTFNAFSGILSEVLTVVGECAELRLAQRIGLRYVNYMRTSAERPLSFFIRPEVAGIHLSEFGISDQSSKYTTMATTPLGRLKVRLSTEKKDTVLPLDLDAAGLAYPQPDANARRTLLDIDHFQIQQIDFEVNELITRMRSLHEYSEKAFIASVTPDAIDYWNRDKQ